MTEYINKDICIVSSISQHDVENWKLDRYGYFTGTRYNQLINFCKTDEQKRALARKICGIDKDKIPEENMKYVKYGIDNEDNIRKILETMTGRKIHEAGFIKSKIYKGLGCSVDGIFECDINNSEYEIAEFKTTKKECPNESYPDFREINIGYYWQMQNNMAITGSTKCHFFSYSYTSNLIYYRVVPFDQKVWDYLRNIAIDFCINYIDPIYDRETKTVKI